MKSALAFAFLMDDNEQDTQQAAQRETMNRSSFYLLIFFFSLLVLNYSDDQAARRTRPTLDNVLESLHTVKQSLLDATFGFNVSNPLPDTVITELHHLQAIKNQKFTPHFYHNITGLFRGNWQSENVTVPDTAMAINKTSQDEHRGSFKFEGNGSFNLNLKSSSTKSEGVNYIEGSMRLKDAEKSDYGILLLAEGVHFLSNGSLYLVGAPPGAASPLVDLLHMLPNNHSMQQTQEVIVEQIGKRIEELKKKATWGGQVIAEQERPMSIPFECTFQMFTQLHPVPSDIKLLELLEYEKELKTPQGISTITPPPPQLSSIMYSPNCGLVLEIENSLGTKIESFYNKAVSYATMASVLAIIQLFSLIHQMEYTPTPSSISNVSYWTIVMQAMMDGYLCLLHLTIGIAFESVFLPFAAAAFFSFILVTVFGMRYSLAIWKIQRPENIRPTTDTNESNTTRENQRRTTILPFVNRPQTNTQNTATDQRGIMDLLLYRLYALLIFGLLIISQLVIRSAFVQNIIIGTIGFVLFSFWVPQITRNIVRGCRRPLSRHYVLGMSVTRLAIPLYIYGCPHNVIAREPSPWIWGFVAYVALQVAVLFLQDLLGPRFFVPEKYLPQTYNYHPILPPTDEENRSQGHTRSHSADHSSDCAICMLPVDTSVSGPTGLHVLGRAHYMMTPCQHLFHTECLEKWMRIKLECPVCRAYLPVC